MKYLDYLRDLLKAENKNKSYKKVLTYTLSDKALSNKIMFDVTDKAYSKIERIVRKKVSGENSEIKINEYIILMEKVLSAELNEFVKEYRRREDKKLEIIIGTSDAPYLIPVGVDVIKLPKICIDKSIREVSKMLNRWPLVFKDERRREVVSPIPFGVALSVESKFGDDLYIVAGNLERVVELDNDLKCVKSTLHTEISESDIYKTTPSRVFRARIKYMSQS